MQIGKNWKWIIGIGIILGIIIGIIAIRSCHDELSEDSSSTESKTYCVNPFEYRSVSSKEKMMGELEGADSILNDMQKKLEAGLSGLNLTLTDNKSNPYPSSYEEFTKMTKENVPIPYNNYFYTKITYESADSVIITCRHVKKGENTIIQIHDTIFRVDDLKDAHSRDVLMEQFANKITGKIKERESIEKIKKELKLLAETTDKKEFIKRSDRVEKYLNELSGRSRENFLRDHSGRITDMRERRSSYK